MEHMLLALESSGIGVWQYSPATNEWMVSATGRELLAISDGFALDSDAIIGALHPADQGHVRHNLQRARSGDSSDAFEIEARTALGAAAPARWVVIKGRAVKSARGLSDELVGTIQDITRQKHSEEASHISAERFRHLSRATRDAVWDWDITVDTAWWNDGLKSLFGHESPPMVPGGTWWIDHIHPEDRARIVSSINNFSDTRDSVWHAEYRFRRADDTYAFVIDRGLIIRDPDGRPIRMLGALADISAAVAAREALRDSEHRLALGLEVGGIGTWDRDLISGKGVWSVQQFSLFGMEPTPDAHCAVEAWTARIHRDDYKNVAAAMECAKVNKTKCQVIFRILRADNDHVRWLQVHGRYYYDDQGAPVRMIGAALDITERVQFEAALSSNEQRLKAAEIQLQNLLKSEQLARTEAERVNRVKDEFLATLSHELRTPLSVIMGHSDLMLDRAGAGHEDMESICAIHRNAHIQLKIVDDLLDVSCIISGNMRLNLETIEPMALIEGAKETVLHAAIAKGIRLSAAYGENLGSFVGDRSRLQQAMWNLLANAIKFTPSGGTVTIATALIDASHITITVTDSGMGVAPEFLPHVFERFRQEDSSSTRRHGGLGLGLAIVRHIIEAHGGSVAAESRGKGLGASFMAVLPTLSASARSKIQRPVVGAESGRRAEILGHFPAEA